MLQKKIATAGIILVAFFALLSCIYWFSGRTHTVAFSTSKQYLDTVGPVEAQKTAWHAAQAGKPLTVGHMYEHEVGAYLFKKYGVTGVRYCKTYFDHGCYNGYMLEMTSLPMIEAALKVCSTMDPDAMSGCIHGAGHEALSLLNNFDVLKALDQCSTFAHTYASSTYSNMLTACTFGVFMENAEPGMMEGMANTALNHDEGMDMNHMGDMHMGDGAKGNSTHTSWARKQNDPLYPCNNPEIKPEYLPGCWREQGTSLGVSHSLTAVITICDSLTNDDQRKACYGGMTDAVSALGKTSVPQMTAGCNTASGLEWKNRCLIYFMRRAYLGGGDDTVPNQICSQIDSSGQAECKKQQTTLKEFLST